MAAAATISLAHLRSSFPLLSFRHGSSSSFPTPAIPFLFLGNCRAIGKPTSPFPRALHDSTAREEEREQFSVLTSVRSAYNDIAIVDTPESRLLLLDSTHNVHSMYNKGQKWTGAYWDEFATLPAIIPRGPVAILGLGGGTAAHLMLELWPSLKLEGWEIDEILIDKAREYLGLSELEKCNQAGGVLHVHVGDALSHSVTVPGGYAGIVVDLFSDGKVLPQLQEVATWLELDKMLMTQGRIMVNCGGAHAEAANAGGVSSNDGTWVQNSTIKALCKAFPGNLSWKRMIEGGGENFLALSGPYPDLNEWSAAFSGQLSWNIRHWRPCELAFYTSRDTRDSLKQHGIVGPAEFVLRLKNGCMSGYIWKPPKAQRHALEANRSAFEYHLDG